MSSIVRLDEAYNHARFIGGSIKDLTTKQDSTLAELEDTFANIRTDDLSQDRLDLLASFAVDDLGTTSAELIVRGALAGKIEERRRRYVDRQKFLSKKLRGNWLAVSLLADELVFRTTWSTSASPYPPIPSGETIYMKLRHAPGDDGFITYPTGRPDANARNYIGYAISGATRSGTGGGFADISIVDKSGSPTVNITPLSSKPPKVNHTFGHQELN
ncbi:MAG: hypothetical protein V4678_01590 [Patescibacteria group bacterium]